MTINYQNRELHIVVSQYTSNDRLYVGFLEKDGEIYGDITVNLKESDNLPDDMAYVDVNNMFQITAIINNYRLGKYMGEVAKSGFCEYPLYKFDMEELRKYYI